MKTIREQEEALFSEWERERSYLVRDGVVDEQSYVSSTSRVLLVLKEVNDENGGGWDLREYLRKGARWQTWNTVTRWIKGIQQLERDVPWSELGSPDEKMRQEYLRTLCVMNLKKSPGGASADHQEVRAVARDGRRFLNRQFALYDPDIVICGGTSDIFIEIIDFDKKPGWRLSTRGLRYWEFAPDKYLLRYYHPQVRYPAPFLYYGLLDAIREVNGHT